MTSKFKLANDLASKIIRYMEAQNYLIFSGFGEKNIIYIEGMNADGTLNADRPNEFNDLRIVLGIANNQPRIEGIWEATTEPGRYYTIDKHHPKGAARIAFGQYKAWQVGTHGNSRPHEALVQTGGNVTVCRDFNKDFKRTGDKLDVGFFGINQHSGYDYPKTDISLASAGCLVGRTWQGHQQFMGLVKKDPRYQRDRRFVFSATILPGDKM